MNEEGREKEPLKQSTDDSPSQHVAISMEEVNPRPTASSRSLRSSICNPAEDFFRNLYKINGQINELRYLMAQLESPKDSHELRASLDTLSTVTTEMIIKAKNDLEQLKSQMEESKLIAASAELKRTMSKFREVQLLLRDRNKRFVECAETLLSYSHLNEEEEGKSNSPNLPEETAVHAGAQIKETDINNEIVFNHYLMEEREKEIGEIENAMSELHELFGDIGLLVSDQQGLLDTIDANIEASAVRARAAVQELHHADNTQRKRKSGMICCSLLGVIFILMFTMAIINSLS